MSVEVKTPTRTQFEHTEFQCGDRSSVSVTVHKLGISTDAISTVNVGGIALHSQANMPNVQSSDPGPQNQRIYRKRKISERSNVHQMGARRKTYRKFGDKIVLPRKFLLGGNITDPLNLNALCHDEIGKELNESTPKSSPLPSVAYKQDVQVLIPPNINDPLNLNGVEEAEPGLISPKFSNKKKKHKHKKKRLSAGDKSESELIESTGPEQSPNRETPCPTSLELNPVTPASTSKSTDVNPSDKLFKKLDKIVSPVISQLPLKVKKLKRLSGEIAKADSEQISDIDVKRNTPPKPKRQISQNVFLKPEQAKKKFVYGNYTKYYGYRNPGEEIDHRLSVFRGEWFKNKNVLDIGCNIGHIALSIARDYCPRRIVGMDIDGKLIGIAKKNIRHYMTKEATDTNKFPASLQKTYGPIAPPPVPTSKDASGFPYNIMFMQGNYVLKTDEELDLVREEYDAILVLSVTKWIHLNWGDDGLKRVFKRLYRHLQPGGKLILEPQPWSSYKKKKKISETIFKTFHQIKFRPEQFTEFLLSKEVGFVACEHLDIPYNKSQGFQRPLQVFIKAETGSTPVEGVTPLMHINCTPSGSTPQLPTHGSLRGSSRSNTPKFEVESGITPCSSCQNTPTYLCSTWSGDCTPINDSDTGDTGNTPNDQDSEQFHNHANQDVNGTAKPGNG